MLLVESLLQTKLLTRAGCAMQASAGHRLEVVDVMRQAAGDAVDGHRVSEAGEVGA